MPTQGDPIQDFQLALISKSSSARMIGSSPSASSRVVATQMSSQNIEAGVEAYESSESNVYGELTDDFESEGLKLKLERIHWVDNVRTDVINAVHIAMTSASFQHYIRESGDPSISSSIRASLILDIERLVRWPSQSLRAIGAFFQDPPIELVHTDDASQLLVGGAPFLMQRKRRVLGGKTRKPTALDFIDIGLEIILVLAAICKVKVSQKSRQDLVLEAIKKCQSDLRWRRFWIALVRLKFKGDIRKNLKLLYGLLADEAVGMEVLKAIWGTIEIRDILMALGRMLGFLALSFIPGVGTSLYLGGIGAAILAIAEKLDRFSWPEGMSQEGWEGLFGPLFGASDGASPVGPEPYRPPVRRVKKKWRVGMHEFEDWVLESDPPSPTDPMPGGADSEQTPDESGSSEGAGDKPPDGVEVSEVNM